VATSIQRSTKIKSLPAALNCTRSQAGQLVDEGVLDPIVDGLRQSAGRTRKAIRNQDIEWFLSALRSTALTVVKIPDGMIPIAKASEKVKLSSVEIVHLVLGGFLQNVMRLESADGYANILVDPAEIRTNKDLHLPGISAAEAFGRLKIPKSTGWELVGREDNPRLSSIVVEGPSGQHRFYRFSEDCVATFLAKYTTEIRVANANDIEQKDVIKTLKNRGVRPVLSKADIGVDFYRTEDILDFEPA
jgi:hypothetical protein